MEGYIQTLCPVRRCLQESVYTCTNIVKASFVKRILMRMFEHSQNIGLYARFFATGSLSNSIRISCHINILYHALSFQYSTMLLSKKKLGPLGSFAFLFCWSKYIMIACINNKRLNSVNKSTVFYRSWESTKCIYVFPSVVAVNVHINQLIFVKECDVFMFC